MDLNELLLLKETELTAALELVRSLQKQITTIRATVEIANGIPEQFPLNLAGERPSPPVLEAASRLRKTESDQPKKRKRNPRGLVERLILEALKSGLTSLDQIFAAVNAAAEVPLNRGSLRTQLMMLKNEGIVKSEKAGMFSLPTKGESLAADQSN